MKRNNALLTLCDQLLQAPDSSKHGTTYLSDYKKIILQIFSLETEEVFLSPNLLLVGGTKKQLKHVTKSQVTKVVPVISNNASTS